MLPKALIVDPTMSFIKTLAPCCELDVKGNPVIDDEPATETPFSAVKLSVTSLPTRVYFAKTFVGAVVHPLYAGVQVPSSYQFSNSLVMPAVPVFALKSTPLPAVPITTFPAEAVRLVPDTARPAVKLATETLTVLLPCTIGRTSVPASGVVAAVSAEIF
jgi:hypothetical protein